MRIDWHCETRGEHALPAVVILHGFMGTAGDWEAVITPLSDEFYCVAVDLPGHGRTSARDSAEISMETVAASLIDLVDELSLDHFSVVGYSMGGRLALYWSTIFSMRIDRLVLESASPGLASEEEQAARQAHDEALARRLETEDFEAFLNDWYAQPMFASLAAYPILRNQMIMNRLLNDPFRLAQALRGLGTGAQPSLWHELRNHHMPVLLVAGEHDQKYREINNAMAERMPAAEAVIVPDAGHSVHLEKPAAYNALLHQFLTA